jgi:hypothetical protein
VRPTDPTGDVRTLRDVSGSGLVAEVTPLRACLTEWTDFDCAARALGISIGLFTPEQDLPLTLKHVFWSRNPVGEALNAMLMELVHAGVLLYDDDLRFKWNPDFKGTWEREPVNPPPTDPSRPA